MKPKFEATPENVHNSTAAYRQNDGDHENRHVGKYNVQMAQFCIDFSCFCWRAALRFCGCCLCYCFADAVAAAVAAATASRSAVAWAAACGVHCVALLLMLRVGGYFKWCTHAPAKPGDDLDVISKYKHAFPGNIHVSGFEACHKITRHKYAGYQAIGHS